MIPHTPGLRPIARDEAENLAIGALAFLAGEPERLSRFLALSGLDPAHLRQAAAEPGFLSGVLAFLAGDERMLLDFAAAQGCPPERIAAACRSLNPELSGDPF